MAYILTIILLLFCKAEASFKPGEIIVKIKDGRELSSLSKLKMSSSLKLFEGVRLYNLQSQISVTEAVRLLENDPNVEYAEPNYYYHVSKQPDDEHITKQWALENKGQSFGVFDADIDAVEAWSLTTGSKDITIAIIDTGIDYNHEDLKNNMWLNLAEENGKPGVDDDQNGFIDDIYGVDFVNNDSDPMDDYSHGTHCAGIIGAEGNNGIGISGVNWNVKMMAIKFLNSQGAGLTTNAIKSIMYAVNNGAKVINNSWGGVKYSKALKEAIEYATSKNILVVNAAGNRNNDNDRNKSYPSSYEIPGMIGVASTDQQDLRSIFSSYGTTSIHLAAPGSAILSTMPGNKYENMSGTSMASPYVAGSAALLMSFMPELTALEVKERLLRSTDKLKGLEDKVVSSGRLNINNALRGIFPVKDWVDVDPELFTEYNLTIESPHPYPSKFNQSWEIVHTGAKYLRVYFELFRTEKGYDFIDIIDVNGKVLESLSGDRSGLWSSSVKGEKIVVRLRSDKHFTDKGFKISKYGAVVN